MPGTLRMLGYSVSERDGFLNTIRSYDPAMSSAPAIYANGLQFSGATNHLVVKNATQSPINVWGTIYPLTTNGSSKMIAIPKAFLVADSSAALELPAADESLDGAAIQLETSGPNGSLVASYVSHDRNNQITRSMSFKGIPEGSSPAGGYPWRLDGNYDSKTYITNVSKIRAAFGAFIDPKDGQRYVIDTHYLEPGETAIIDFRKLRDQQMPDRNRLKLPKDAKFGAIQWFPLFFNGSQHFIGRTEVIDRSSAVAANFSCEACPCPPDAGSGYVTPGSVSLQVGGSTSVYTSVTQRDVCYFNQLPDYTFPPYSWNDPSFISLTIGNSPSTLTALAPGQGSYFARFDAASYVYNPFQSPQCMYQSNHEVDATGNVTVPGPTSFSGPSFAPNNVIVYTGQQLNDCLGNPDPDFPTFYGYQRCAYYQLLDQSGANMAAEIAVPEQVTVQQTNVGVNSHTANAGTNANGLLGDQLVFGSVTRPPASGDYALDLQIFTTTLANGQIQTLRINCLDYEATDVRVTDVTSQGANTTCTRQ